MIFYSMSFFFFFIILLFLIQIIHTSKTQQWLFLAANVIFYAYWDVRFLVLLFFIIGICYISAILYQKSCHKIYIIFPTITCLLILGIFKYYNFFVSSFCSAFHILEYHTLEIILPLGISFYLFQALSYIFDVKNKAVSAEHNFVKLAAYISFFPQITSGPIVKAHDFLPQLERPHRIKKENLYLGLQQFTLGLTKKLVFADQIGVAVNAVYAAPAAYNGISILFAVIGYSLQIYFDFSGYSDMAIGIARILDFDLGINFNLPYLATNPSDFWKRWHISLSSWFQKYVYIPLGGSRNGQLKTYRNLFITMLLSGLWHGANWTFVVWGFLHALGSTLHKFFHSFCTHQDHRPHILLSIVCNFIFVSLLWVIFRAANLNQAWQIISGIFHTEGILYINIFTISGILISITCGTLAYCKNSRNTAPVNLHLETFRGKVLYSIWIFSVVVFMYVGNSAFIYAQF